MVAFARAKAKSIFSKLRFQALSETHLRSHSKKKANDISLEKKSGSNYFLEAIKSGGIWLS